MIETEFAWLRDLLHKRSGLAISAEKRYLVDSRLSVVCRQFALPSLSALVQKVRAGDEKLTVAVVEAMTTNETLFFRDRLPFDHLRDSILPALLRQRGPERSLRIWCAAASSGQEPYSIAMLLADMQAEFAGWRVEIVATDISSEMLERARGGLYSQFEVQRGLPVQLLLKHFSKVGDRWQISDAIRRMVSFRQHNLIQPVGHLGHFDVIFCRNVLIYFDVPTKAQVLATLARHLRPDGYLMLGAAESVLGISPAFRPDGEMRGIYRPEASEQARPAAPRPPAPAVVRPALSLVGGRRS